MTPGFCRECFVAELEDVLCAEHADMKRGDAFDPVQEWLARRAMRRTTEIARADRREDREADGTVRDQRQHAIGAVGVLNYFVGDLVAACRLGELYWSVAITATVPTRSFDWVYRICLSYLFLTLDTWAEFYDRFNAIIPADCKGACKELRREIRERPIRRFRNTFVGHVWDKARGRPLTEQEAQEAADAITFGDADALTAWCNDPAQNQFPNTVVAIVERTRDRIREEFKLTDEEIFPPFDP